MRLINLRRVAALAVPVLGLLATMTPPAEATTVALVTFQGSATTRPLSYPCAGAATVDLTKCPGATGTTTVAKVNGTSVDVGVDIGGNSGGFVFSSGPCLATGASTLLGATVIGGACVITAAGALEGSCGLSHGLGTFTITSDTIVPPGTVTISGTFHFFGAGGTLVVTGDTGSNSAVVGIVQAVPVPDLSNPPAIGNSCAQKSATDFTIAGVVALVAA